MVIAPGFGEILESEHFSVQAAFRFAAPGPATGTLVLVQTNRQRAGRTPDTAVAFCKQGMDRQAVFLKIFFHIRFGPIEQRIDFEQAIRLEFQDPGVGPGGGLITADAADPGLHVTEGFLHRLDFVQETAQVRVFKRQGAGMLAGKMVPARVTVQVQNVQLPSRGDLFAGR